MSGELFEEGRSEDQICSRCRALAPPPPDPDVPGLSIVEAVEAYDRGERGVRASCDGISDDGAMDAGWIELPDGRRVCPGCETYREDRSYGPGIE